MNFPAKGQRNKTGGVRPQSGALILAGCNVLIKKSFPDGIGDDPFIMDGNDMLVAVLMFTVTMPPSGEASAAFLIRLASRA